MNKAEVREGTKSIELVLVAEDEAGALQEDRGDLFFTISVENRDPSVYRALSRYTYRYTHNRRTRMFSKSLGEEGSVSTPLPPPYPDPYQEGTEYMPCSSSLLRVITRGRRGPPVSRSLLGVLLVLGLIFRRR